MKFRFVFLLVGLCFVGFSQPAETMCKSLDEALADPLSVTHLDLSGQGLTKLPKGFKNLVNLRHVDLSNNKFSSLPSFSPFEKLEYVNLSNNNFTYAPSFIEIKTGERNLIAENNPFTVFKASSESEETIDQAGFEGKIRLKSYATFQPEKSKKKEDVLRVNHEGAESEYWFIIQKRNGRSNEAIIESIHGDDLFVFAYSVNAHITMNPTTGDLPQFMVYSYTDKTGDVGITSVAYVVFYQEYYITSASSKRSTSYSSLRPSLAAALTYKPEDDGINVYMDKINYKLISPAEFAKMCDKLTPKPVNTNLPALTPKKEIIHTLQSGETVAYTNEYQLGIDLKDNQYYIYLKRGGKYYLKTAKATFGPYDDIPTASPEHRGWLDFVHEMRAIKGGKDYFISGGKEYGPFPNQSYAHYFSEQNVMAFLYQKDTNQYYHINGVDYGPFKNAYYPAYYKGEWVFVDYIYNPFNGTGKMSAYLGTKKIIDEKEVYSSTAVKDGHLMIQYKENGQESIRIDEKVFGPYSDIVVSDVDNGKPWFTYKENSSSFLYYDDQIFGPFDAIYSISATIWKGYFLAKTKDKWVVYQGKNKVADFTGIKPEIAITSDQTALMIKHGSETEKFVFFKGKNYGPFKTVTFPTYSDLEKLKGTNTVPLAVVTDMKDDYYYYLNDLVYGPFKTLPTAIWSTMGSEFVFVVSEETNEGDPEKFVISGDKKIGPFKEVYNSNGKIKYAFGTYPLKTETHDGQCFVMTQGKNLGPFQSVRMFDWGDTLTRFIYRQNDQWFGYENGLVVGPVSLADEERFLSNGYSNWFSHGQVNEEYYRNSEGYSRINNTDYSPYHFITASNGSNFVAVGDDRGGTKISLVINNVQYNSNILNYSYHEETKIFYWLSLEGKNIVRNSVQL